MPKESKKWQKLAWEEQIRFLIIIMFLPLKAGSLLLHWCHRKYRFWAENLGLLQDVVDSRRNNVVVVVVVVVVGVRDAKSGDEDIAEDDEHDDDTVIVFK